MIQSPSAPPRSHQARALTGVFTTLLLTGATSSRLPPGQGLGDDGEGDLIFFQPPLLIFLLLVGLAQWGLNLSPLFSPLILFFLILLAQAEAMTFLLIFLILPVRAAMVGAFFSLL